MRSPENDATVDSAAFATDPGENPAPQVAVPVVPTVAYAVRRPAAPVVCGMIDASDDDDASSSNGNSAAGPLAFCASTGRADMARIAARDSSSVADTRVTGLMPPVQVPSHWSMEPVQMVVPE